MYEQLSYSVLLPSRYRKAPSGGGSCQLQHCHIQKMPWNCRLVKTAPGAALTAVGLWVSLSLKHEARFVLTPSPGPEAAGNSSQCFLGCQSSPPGAQKCRSCAASRPFLVGGLPCLLSSAFRCHPASTLLHAGPLEDVLCLLRRRAGTSHNAAFLSIRPFFPLNRKSGGRLAPTGCHKG